MHRTRPYDSSEVTFIACSGSEGFGIKNNCLSDRPLEGILKGIIRKGGGEGAVFMCCAEENYFCLDFFLEEMSVEGMQEAM